MDIFQIKYAA